MTNDQLIDMSVIKKPSFLKPSSNRDSSGATLFWRDLSVYAMDRDQKTINKQLINNGKCVFFQGILQIII